MKWCIHAVNAFFIKKKNKIIIYFLVLFTKTVYKEGGLLFQSFNVTLAYGTCNLVCKDMSFCSLVHPFCISLETSY